MTNILTLSGSPSANSRSSAVLAWTRRLLEQDGFGTGTIEVRELPSEALLHAEFANPAIQAGVLQFSAANAVIIATPVYKASYTGVLKAFLDLLPQDILSGKIVLPIATGGSLAHLLMLDYALHPVLSALGACHVLRGVYLPDSQIHRPEKGAVQFAEEAEERLRGALGELAEEVNYLKARASAAREAIR